jgi:hypothetical protein
LVSEVLQINKENDDGHIEVNQGNKDQKINE